VSNTSRALSAGGPAGDRSVSNKGTKTFVKPCVLYMRFNAFSAMLMALGVSGPVISTMQKTDRMA